MSRCAQDLLLPRPQSVRSGSESDETVVAEGSHSESSVEATMCAGDRIASDRSRGRISRAEAQGAVRRARSSSTGLQSDVSTIVGDSGSEAGQAVGKECSPESPTQGDTPQSRLHAARNQEPEVGNMSIYAVNWGNRGHVMGGKKVQRDRQMRHDRQLKNNPASIVVMCEANSRCEKLLEEPVKTANTAVADGSADADGQAAAVADGSADEAEDGWQRGRGP